MNGVRPALSRGAGAAARAGLDRVAVLLALWLAGPAPAPAATLEPGVVAKVNGATITRHRLQNSVDAYMNRRRMDAGGIFDPGRYKGIERQVLDVLIAQELLWQDARDQGLIVDQGEVDAALAELRSRAGSARMYRSRVEAAGFNEETFAEDLRRRMSVHRLVAERIEPRVEVTGAEIEAFYHANAGRFVAPEQIRVRHILIEVAPDAPDEDRAAARARIEALIAKLEDGADFAALAREHSQDSSGPDGGDLGFFGRGRTVAPFEAAAFALPTGGISGPVRTVFGYHVIKVEERREGGRVPLGQVAGRIREHLSRRKRQDAIEAHVARLRNAASLEISARLWQ